MSNRNKELKDKILKARSDYYNHQSTISDKVFDAWVDELKALDPNNKAVTSIGAPVVQSEWKKAKHQIPMGSLDKVNTPDELTKWAKEHASDEILFVTEKLDGLSIELIYDNGNLVQAITRGSGFEGEDITVNVIKMGGVILNFSSKYTGSLRGEIIMKKSIHKEFFSDKANPRNAASGTCKRLDGEGAHRLDILFYQALGNVDFPTELAQFNWLTQQGLITPNFWLRTLSEVNEHWRDYQDTKRDALDYDIDGLVVRINDLIKQAALGDKDMRPKGAVAFKFDNEARESTIRDIVWQTGNSGRLTPVAVVDPVMLVGAEVKRASIYNLSYIEELKLDVGAKVLVARANDVIPRVEELIQGTGTIAKAPNECPACGGQLEMQGENLQCISTDTCPAQVVGRIKNWVAELNLLELGDTLMERLVSSNLVKDVSDLYKLSVDDLCKLERMAEKSATNVYNSLWKTTSLPLEQLIGALSISMIGTTMVKLLTDAGYDTLDSLFNVTKEQVESVKGMGPVKAELFVVGMKRNKDLIGRLLSNGVKIKDKIMGTLTNKSLSFTGAMENKRQVLEQMVLDAGGTVKSSVSSGLSYLVISDVNSTSSKAKSARKLGTTLISEEQFLQMVK